MHCVKNWFMSTIRHKAVLAIQAQQCSRPESFVKAPAVPEKPTTKPGGNSFSPLGEMPLGRGVVFRIFINLNFIVPLGPVCWT